MIPIGSSSYKKINTGVIGAAGFTGRELIRLICRHSRLKLSLATSTQYSSQKLADVFPELEKLNSNLVFTKHPETTAELPDLDIIFIAAPDTIALRWVEPLLEKNIKIIDLGGSFRLQNISEFEDYYQLSHTASHLVPEAVYGLSEVYRDEIASARLLSNPGCYPTASLLPLWFIKDYIKECFDVVIIDAKSGVSGAGARKEKDQLAFSSVYENFYAYKTQKHQHQPEIKSQLNSWLSRGVNVRFTPHLLPIFRGILSTIYIPLHKQIDFNQIYSRLRERVSQERFIRFYEHPDLVQIKNVRGTNFLDFSIQYDNASGVFVIISAIDNLLKGASGQAMQNLNIMFGFEETLSLIK